MAEEPPPADGQDGLTFYSESPPEVEIINSTASDLASNAIDKAYEACKNTCYRLFGHPSALASNKSFLEVQTRSTITQILLPVQSFTDDSVLRLVSPTFAAKHTVQLDESEVDGNMEVHREEGAVLTEFASAKGEPMGDVNDTEAFQEDAEGTGAPKGRHVRSSSVDEQDYDACIPPGSGQRESACSTLIEQMAESVAVSAVDAINLRPTGVLEDIAKKFSDVAKAACRVAMAANDNCRLERCRQRNARGGGGTTTGPEKKKLPPEVKERILKTLSEVRDQLDGVKNQLRERGNLPKNKKKSST